MALDEKDLRILRTAIEARLAVVEEEAKELRALLVKAGRGESSAVTTTQWTRKRRRRTPMSAAQREAVGERMRKYWKARKAKAKKG